QYVHISYGPWLENSEGGLEVQADLYPDASGQAQVFRNGVEITGTWQRSALGSPTQFLTAAGTPITLQPGQTWVELVPDTIATATSSREPSRLMPLPYMMSNSACLNGAEHLFLTTLTRVRLPITSAPSF